MHGAHERIASKVDWVVVTDLDGTLLDHHTYSYGPAQSALQRLAEAGIPLVLNTSKTRPELAVLRKELGNQDPFIVENGSAVFVPEARFVEADTRAFLARECAAEADHTESDGALACKVFGRDYQAIVSWLQQRRKRYRFEAFSDYSVADLCARTGLPEAQARLALAREFSEPLLWQDSPAALQQFERELAAAGYGILRGGRFLHILGECDKGQSMAWLRRCYAVAWGRQPRVVALGDSHNDVAMLEAADIAVLVRSPKHEAPIVAAAGELIVSEQEGPRGWGEVIHSLLDRMMQQ